MPRQLTIMAKRPIAVLATLLLIAASGCSEALAGYASHAGYPATGFVRVAARPVSMRDAINKVRQQTGGRVLDAQDLGSQYRIKVLTPKGDIRIFHVDAQTGAVR
jgi:uncharacterized membrane protein YkoI